MSKNEELLIEIETDGFKMLEDLKEGKQFKQLTKNQKLRIAALFKRLGQELEEWIIKNES